MEKPSNGAGTGVAWGRWARLGAAGEGEAWSLRGRTQFRAVGVTARTKKCLKGITCVRFTPKMRVYAVNCVTPAQRNFLPRRLHASPLHGSRVGVRPCLTRARALQWLRLDFTPNMVNSVTKPAFSDGPLRFSRYLWKKPPMVPGLAWPGGGGRGLVPPVRARQCLAPTCIARGGQDMPDPCPGLAMVGGAARRRVRARQCLAPTARWDGSDVG